jgi:hypothetical protein
LGDIKAHSIFLQVLFLVFCSRNLGSYISVTFFDFFLFILIPDLKAFEVSILELILADEFALQLFLPLHFVNKVTHHGQLAKVVLVLLFFQIFTDVFGHFLQTLDDSWRQLLLAEIIIFLLEGSAHLLVDLFDIIGYSDLTGRSASLLQLASSGGLLPKLRLGPGSKF